MIRLLSFLVICALSLPVSSICQSKKEKDQPIELGDINWYRNFNEALVDARIKNKPILILFQEIPGCATCRNYGQNILTHPLIVEALENEFVPLAIYNNKSGADAQILKKFDEPAWNNPVVRIINFEERNLTDRLSGDYTLSGLALKIKLGLLRSHGSIPEYIKLLADELVAEDTGQETTYFKMYCFWSGEAHLGAAEGVISTAPGFMSCGEVVQVNYDPQLLDEATLTRYAKEAQCKPVSHKTRFRNDKDPQYYLKKSKYRFLPLTKAQRTKINSALGHQQDPDVFLSPRQLRWKTNLKDHEYNKYPILYCEDFIEAWALALTLYD